MRNFVITLGTEILKMRKSKVFWISFIFFAFIPSMMSLIFLIQKHPELAAKLGIIGTKATIIKFGEPNWANYFALINQAIAAIGLIGFSFVTSWVFGREYTDKTIKDLLALPTSRQYIVAAKLTVSVIWSALLVLVFLIISLLIGFTMNFGDTSSVVVVGLALRFCISALLTMQLITPVAFLACYSRGFLLPLGFAIFTLILANFTGVVGLGPYFPWAIPGIYSVGSGAEGMILGIPSYLILAITCIAGIMATMTWFRYADQK